MTAEIAIMNKTAVVLAADSAVTIGGGNSAKIYNTVNKIFEINNTYPIGLMIFNNLNYMGLPIEVLAKEYRQKSAGVAFPHISDAMDHFLDYLQNGVPISNDDMLLNVAIVISDAVDLIMKDFMAVLTDDISNDKPILKSKFNSMLQEIIDKKIEELKEKDFADNFKSDRLSADQKALCLRAAERKMKLFKFSQKTKSAIYRYVAQVIKRQELSSFYTGLVFAGFGEDDLCPSLAHVEIDGIINGKIKKVEHRYIDIGRDGPAAEILGFAQDDMVQSFVNGVDPVFRKYVAGILRHAIEESARMIISPVTKNQSQTQKLIDGLQSDFDRLAADYEKKANDYIDSEFTQDIKEMVRAMPKQELSNLAESLIDITKLKRKVTRERETVGGDVDVAVISKAEGLVWVKRKHYFPPELNPRFLDRQRQR